MAILRTLLLGLRDALAIWSVGMMLAGLVWAARCRYNQVEAGDIESRSRWFPGDSYLIRALVLLLPAALLHWLAG